MLAQPLLHLLEQFARPSHSLLRHCGADRLSGIVRDITLLTQAVEYHHGLAIQTDGPWQALNHGLVVARRTGQRPEAIGLERRIRRLHDALISHVETAFAAHVGQLSVRQAAFGGLEQAPDIRVIRLDALQQTPQQISSVIPAPWARSSHAPCQSRIVWAFPVSALQTPPARPPAAATRVWDTPWG